VYYYYHEWTSYLRGANALLGIPFCIAGATLVLMGWRIWRPAAVVSLGLVGLIVGQMLSGDANFNAGYALGSAGAFGIAGLLLPTQAATVVAALVGGCVASLVTLAFGYAGTVHWIVIGLGALGAGAWAFANRHKVVITITSAEGGILLVSGLSIMLAEWPYMYNFLRAASLHSGFVLPFFILVPTVIGVTLQLADANRSASKMVRS
jgi:hypothetical protein